MDNYELPIVLFILSNINYKLSIIHCPLLTLPSPLYGGEPVLLQKLISFAEVPVAEKAAVC